MGTHTLVTLYSAGAIVSMAMTFLVAASCLGVAIHGTMKKTGTWGSWLFFILASLCWVLIDLAVAIFAFYRFRFTASGLLVGIAYIVLVLRTLAFSLAVPQLLTALQSDRGAFAINYVASAVIRSAAYVVIIAGVLLIPRSLRKLAEKT